MSAPPPTPFARMDAFTSLLKDMYHRLEDGTRVINDLKRRVAILEGKPLITPMNPEQIRIEDDNRLVFTVGNAEYVEFVDVCVNRSAWLRFWAKPEESNASRFIREDKTIIIPFTPLKEPVHRIEVFTRYDKHSQTTEAGRNVLTF